MKLLILSDSHGSAENMRRVVLIENPDMLLFLGDGQCDLQMILKEFPALECHAVRGNCDYASDLAEEALVEAQGVRIFMCHGHTYGVKHSYDRLLRRGYLKRAKLVLSGHTHTALIRERLGLTLINPGSVGYYYDPTYAVVWVEDASVVRQEIRHLQSPVFEP